MAMLDLKQIIQQWARACQYILTQSAIIAAIREEPSWETSLSPRMRLMTVDWEYLPPLPPSSSLRMKKIHSCPLVRAPRMILFLKDFLEWCEVMKLLAHSWCLAHAYNSASACGMWLSSLWSGPLASVTQKAWAANLLSLGFLKRQPATKMSEKETCANKDMGTGMCLSCQDCCEVDKTGQNRVGLHGNRQNNLLNIENKFWTARQHESNTKKKSIYPQAHCSFILVHRVLERFPGFNIRNTHCLWNKTFQEG